MSFSEEQREVILNNVTLKTDELYLDYWINIGRGLDDDAIDAAKRLDDSDLVIYAIVQKMDQVRKDNSLSGKDREQKLSELQTDYDKYWKDRKTALTDEESKSKIAIIIRQIPTKSHLNHQVLQQVHLLKLKVGRWIC